jgi:1,2-diacylglycerol 3-beta-galactosyltransferase
MRAKITLIYVEAGGGHRAAAVALREIIRRQGRPWDVRMVCAQDLLDPIDLSRKFTGVPFQEVYNVLLRKGWTAGTAQLLPVMHLFIRLSHRQQVKVLQRYWEESRPDLVVSLIPHYNRALRDSLERAWPGVPYVTLLTDIVDFPPHFWIEPLDQWVICGSGRAAAQALELGIPEERILRTSGMILNPKFYNPVKADRAAELERLGLRPDLPTGLVLFGGQGSAQMLRIAQALNHPENRVQLILLCGRNEKLAADLRALEQRIPMAVHGFTSDVPLYMDLCDFFIGKPGPGSISEALAKGLPVIVERNFRTMAHERYNADWVEESGFGLVVRDFGADIAQAVRELLVPETYALCRERAAEARNFAVYEIPALLEKVLQADSSLVPELLARAAQ